MGLLGTLGKVAMGVMIAKGVGSAMGGYFYTILPIVLC